MALYDINIIPVEDLTFSGAAPARFSHGAGGDWNGQSYNFTLSTDGVQTAEVSDADGLLQDDPEHPEWASSNTHAVHDQVLVDDLTIGGRTFAAGASIEDEYELDVVGEDGTVYRMVAISVQNDPTDDNAGYTVVGFTFEGPWPPQGTSLCSVDRSAQDGQSLVPCFTPEVRIASADGEREVRHLAVGDLVMTMDAGYRPIRWIRHRRLTRAELARAPHLRPVRIRAGALGAGLPARDLVVSPQHRVLVGSRIAERMFGSREVLVAARQLLALDGVEIDARGGPVTYWHFALDNHQVVFAENLPAETLFLGPMALAAMSDAARAELLEIFPALARDDARPLAARPLVPGRPARQLVARHMRNCKPLIDAD